MITVSDRAKTVFEKVSLYPSFVEYFSEKKGKFK